MAAHVKYDRAMRSNLGQAELERNVAIHNLKIRNAKASVDTKPPRFIRRSLPQGASKYVVDPSEEDQDALWHLVPTPDFALPARPSSAPLRPSYAVPPRPSSAAARLGTLHQGLSQADPSAEASAPYHPTARKANSAGDTRDRTFGRLPPSVTLFHSPTSAAAPHAGGQSPDRHLPVSPIDFADGSPVATAFRTSPPPLPPGEFSPLPLPGDVLKASLTPQQLAAYRGFVALLEGLELQDKLTLASTAVQEANERHNNAPW
eukprot:GGOE01054336.1.p1 GENE.GGOE01054336.1~~GGOE01054336.1.p1  ORF type:complete len:261 (+),score=56.68 GGOE01054336.1:46-828(+)